MLLVSVGAFLFAPPFAMLPHIDMGGYRGKVRKISGKVHFFLDVTSEMLFEVCRICGFVSRRTTHRLFFSLSWRAPAFCSLLVHVITRQQFSFYAPRMGRCFLRCSR